MKFFEDLATRTLTFIDNHPRWLAFGIGAYSVFVHPFLTVFTVIVVAFVAYFVNESKK